MFARHLRKAGKAAARGMTLIEIMVVLVILGLIAGAIGYNVFQPLLPKYVRELRKDPWGKDYAYLRAGEGYDVYSFGPDKAQGGGDDITVHGGDTTGPSTAGK